MSEVRLTYDTDVMVEVGDILESAATGRCWLVIDVHVVTPRVILEHRYRLRRTTLVVPEDYAQEDDTIHPLYWKPRG